MPDSITERLDALEAQIKELPLDALPLEPLKRKVGQWLPQVSDDLQVGIANMSDFDAGTTTVTFSANNDSDVVTVKHRLAVKPRGVLLSSWQPTLASVVLYVINATVTDKDFQIRGRTSDGTSQTGQAGVAWLAFA